jgi:hypothetical protein
MMNRLLLFLMLYATGSALAQTPFMYDAVGFDDYNDPFVKVRKDGKNYFCHPGTGLLVDEVKDHAGNLLTVVKDGGYGVANENGKLLCSLDNDEVKLLTDYTGQWYSGIPYNYQFAQVKRKGKYGLIDQHGKVIAEPRFQALEIINKDIIGFKEDDKWGWLRVTDGKVIQPPLYDELGKGYLFDHTLQIYLSKKQGIAHESGKVLIAPEHEQLSNIILKTKKYVQVFKGKNSGLMDSLGTIVLPAVYPSLSACLGSDFLRIEEAGRHGLIDINGNEVTPTLYDKINDFVRGRAVVEKAGRKGVINEKGELLLSPQYERIELLNSAGQPAFESPIISVGVQSADNLSTEYLNRKAAEDKMKSLPYYMMVKNHEHKFGIYDWATAKVIVPEKFTEINTVYQHGETYFQAANGNMYALYDKKGTEILPLKYEREPGVYINQGYSYGERNTSPYILPVYDRKKLGIYDVQKRKFIVPPSEMEISWLNERCFELKRRVAGESYTKESAVYNIDGEVMIPYNSDIYQLDVLNDNLLLAEMKTQYVVFNGKGSRVFEHPGWNRDGYYRRYSTPKFGDVRKNPFQSGLFKIRIKEEDLFINESGKEVRFAGFAYVGDFYNNLAWVVREKGSEALYGLIDIKGNVVLEPEYQRAEVFSDDSNLVLVKKNDKFGIVNGKGKMIVEPIYDMISTFSTKLIELRLNDKSGLADVDGKIVVEPRFDALIKNYHGGKDSWPILAQEGTEFSFINEGGSPVLVRGKSKI